MKTIKLIIILTLILGLSSCVTTELTQKLSESEMENKNLKQENMDLKVQNTELKAEIDRVKKANQDLAGQNNELKSRMESNTRQLENIRSENEEFKKQIDALSSGSSSEIRNLLEELQSAREQLNVREDRLKAAEDELESRNAKLVELENILNQKDQAVKELKNKVANALTGFNNNGLTVYEKNGKVYVSLEERLLFKTGEWDVDPNGQKAIKNLAEVLAQNPDINIMVEGHTDNVPMHGSGDVKDNWDLSVMRATAVTKILTQNKMVDPSRIISAGRSEYVPIEQGDSPESRQKNRRTEIILTPKLDELLKIIEMN
ncbi:MAG: OmpA family protein [Prolixibacteraceae bacterium]|nr:OmpA family protein [Prolixibacteraceae bacterium]MBN2773842.1 OmpA family protein [Prolixibacteraceae bacterium]